MANRVIIGLSAVIRALMQSEASPPEDDDNDDIASSSSDGGIPRRQRCILLADADYGDSATHMIEVLLKAFCIERNICIIHVDNSHRLAQLVGILGLGRSASADVHCVCVEQNQTMSDACST